MMRDMVTTPKVLGIGYDARSSFMRGPATAPDVVRRVLHAGSANYSTELGADVAPDTVSYTHLTLPTILRV